MFRLLILCVFITCSLHAGYTLTDGNVYDSKYVPSMTPEKHFESALNAFKNENWSDANQQFLTLIKSFKNTSWEHDAGFYSGVCYFQLGNMSEANKYLSAYLSELESASHYEEAFAYKFAIAEQYLGGGKQHLFNIKALPKLSSGFETALEIYDEIIFSLPASDLAARSYFSKAMVLQLSKDYVEAIDTYQQLITKFPTHEKSAQAFGEISKVYLSKLKRSTLDPDLLELARMNLRKASSHFPRAPVVRDVNRNVLKMEEEYALNLYETGRLYERKNEPKASVVYYYNVIQSFPETKAAQISKKRLVNLKKYINELGIQVDA